MKHKILICFLLIPFLFSCNEANNKQAGNSPPANGVYFVNLKNGDTVKSPVIIEMGVNGMSVEPAGTVHEGKGHHHLIIDGDYIDKGAVVPSDVTHLHFGKGQTIDTLSLSPGSHTLTLQFADGAHRSYGKDWSSTIKVTVIQ